MKLSIDGCAINCEYAPQPGATASVVLIHGWADSLHDSDRTVADLSSSFTMLRFDLPGHGASDRLERYSIAGYTRSTAGLIAALGIDRPVLVGHSMGAILATRLWRANPSAYAKVILIGPPLETFGLGRRLLLPGLAIARASGSLAPVVDLLRRNQRFQECWCDWLIAPVGDAVSEARAITVAGMVMVDREAIVQGVVDILTDRMIADPPMKSPLFYAISGSDDPVTDGAAVRRAFLPDHVFEIPGELHAPNLTRSTGVNAILREIIG